MEPPGSAVTLRADRLRDALVLTVRDHGPVIDPATVEQLFQRFESAGGKRRGVGLGLSIVRSFMELHGGTSHTEARASGGAPWPICVFPLDQRRHEAAA